MGVNSEESKKSLAAVLVYSCWSFIHYYCLRKTKKGNDKISLFSLIYWQITYFDLLIPFEFEILRKDSDKYANTFVSQTFNLSNGAYILFQSETVIEMINLRAIAYLYSAISLHLLLTLPKILDDSRCLLQTIYDYFEEGSFPWTIVAEDTNHLAYFCMEVYVFEAEVRLIHMS